MAGGPTRLAVLDPSVSDLELPMKPWSRLLNVQGAQAQLTGNAADQAMFSFTIPPNTLGNGRMLRLYSWWRHDLGTAAVTYKLIAGATTLFTQAHTSSATTQYSWEHYLFNQVNNTTEFNQAGLVQAGTALVPMTTPGNTTAVDWTASQALKLTFNVAATDKVTPLLWTLEIL